MNVTILAGLTPVVIVFRVDLYESFIFFYGFLSVFLRVAYALSNFKMAFSRSEIKKVLLFPHILNIFRSGKKSGVGVQ